MAIRPMYHVILKDLCKDDRELWTPAIRKEIKGYLTGWFQQICVGSTGYNDASAECWWSSNRMLVDADELVVYFLPQKRDSIIARRGAGTVHTHHTGLTAMVGNAIVSEVYIWENTRDGMRDPRHSRLLALVALHELMHNKLDVDANMPARWNNKDITNMHSELDGIATGAKIVGNSVVSENNIKVMSENLELRHAQYTGHLFAKAGSLP